MSADTSLIVVFGKIAALLGSLPDDATRRRVIEAIQCLLEPGPEPVTTTQHGDPDEIRNLRSRS
jgi:hypothetical protein